MKNLLFAILMLIVEKPTYAANFSKFYPGELPNCPPSGEQLLEIINFIPSADSRSTKGICFVKAKYYSWWDLINERRTPSDVEVEAGICESHTFIKIKDKILINSEVSYQGKISMCGSNPGWHYECIPKIKIHS